jgi:hypothetical protein
MKVRSTKYQSMPELSGVKLISFFYRLGKVQYIKKKEDKGENHCSFLANR